MPGSLTSQTANISATASPGEVQTALEAIPSIGTGNVEVEGGPGDAEGTNPYVITFNGKFADTNVRKITTTNVSLTGGSPSTSVSVSTPTEGGGVRDLYHYCGPPDGEEGGEALDHAPGR